MKNLKIGILAVGIIGLGFWALTSISARKHKKQISSEEIFNKLDKNQDGNIDKDEFLKASKMRGPKMTKKGKKHKKDGHKGKFSSSEKGQKHFRGDKGHKMSGHKTPKSKFHKVAHHKKGKAPMKGERFAKGKKGHHQMANANGHRKDKKCKSTCETNGHKKGDSKEEKNSNTKNS